MNRKKHNKHAKGGFTLIELLVVLTIISIISLLLIAGYRQFGSRITLQNLAYKVALTIKEAQVYGALGRYQSIVKSADSFTAIPIGVRLVKGNPSKIILFKDVNSNKKIDTDEILSSYKMIGDYTIASLKGVGDSGASNLSGVYIFFKRPKPDAEIRNDSEKFKSLSVVLESPFGDKIEVFINSIGLITVKQIQ